jgi:integrase
MRGSIRQQSKETWQITVDVGVTPDGKRLRHFETIKGRKADAQRRLNEILVSVDKGTYAPTGRQTVAELLQLWLDGYVKTNCTLRTMDGYRSIIERHLIPAMGHVPLRQLQPAAIQAYYGDACQRLSARTVHHHHRVLSQSLKYAVRQGYLGRSPCELVDPPSPRRKTMRTLTPVEVDVLLLSASDSPYYAIIYTALSTGLRQAELLGLRWRDVDLHTASLLVSQVLYKRKGVCQFKEPKTPHSRRRVAMTPKLADFLTAYKLERQRVCEELEAALCLDDLVFASASGGPVNPTSVSHAFSKLARSAGLGDVRFHDLRHTFASLMLLRGAKPKVISEALGHASVAFTMDVYSHIIGGMQEDAMRLLDEVLPAGRVCTVSSRNCRDFSSV